MWSDRDESVTNLWALGQGQAAGLAINPMLSTVGAIAGVANLGIGLYNATQVHGAMGVHALGCAHPELDAALSLALFVLF